MKIATQRNGLGATPGDAKQHNRALVLQTLHELGPISRADIARATGLTKVTVSGLVAELVGEELAHELGQRESQRPGKPAMLIDLDRHSHAVVCLDLSDHLRFRGAVLDLDGEVLAREEIERDGATGEAAVSLAIELMLRLLRANRLPLLGVGVGTPGVVDDHGVVRTAPNLHWNELPLQALLAQHTDLPVCVANDANVAAIAEHRYGSGGDDFILITIGQGVGSGILLGGRPMTGSSFASGEIGQVMVGTELGVEADYSREHVLERWLSVPAVTSALEEAERNDEGDAGRTRVLREAGMRLGIALAPVIGALNLAEVVLAGPRDLIEGALAEATLDTLRRRTLPMSHSSLVIHTSELQQELVLRGALAIVLAQRLGIT